MFSAIYSTASGRVRSAGVTSSLSFFTSAFGLKRGVTVAWSKTMTTTFAKASSRSASCLVCLQRLCGPRQHGRHDFHPDSHFRRRRQPGEIVVALDCDTEDRMGNWPVETLVAADTVATTVADAFDQAVLEATDEATAGAAEPMIRSVEAIVVEVNQTAVIVVRGDPDTKIEQPALTAAIAAPSVEPTDTMASAESVSQPNEEKAGQAAAAIALEVTQPETLAIAGEPVDDPVVTDSIGESSSTTPVSMAVGNNDN
jgi:hypothetical protein